MDDSIEVIGDLEGEIQYSTTDQILAIAFGDVYVELGCVVVGFRVRTYEDVGPIKNMTVEGSRDGVLIHHEILTKIAENSSMLLDLMVEMGADKDLLPHPKGPVPMWNAGPSINDCNGVFYLCQGFGFKEPVEHLGAIIAWLEFMLVSNPPGKNYGANYLMSYPVLKEFLENIPKVLRRMKQKGAVGL